MLSVPCDKNLSFTQCLRAWYGKEVPISPGTEWTELHLPATESSNFSIESLMQILPLINPHQPLLVTSGLPGVSLKSCRPVFMYSKPMGSESLYNSLLCSIMSNIPMFMSSTTWLFNSQLLEIKGAKDRNWLLQDLKWQNSLT